MKRLLFFLNLLIITIILSTSLQAQEFWGMTRSGGETAAGVIFKTDINGENFQAVYHFQQYTGSRPYGHVVEAENGLLYGLTDGGGIQDLGLLFCYDPAEDKYTVKVEFDGENGHSPEGSMILASNKLLYGVTPGGGTNHEGVIFEFDPETEIYDVRFSFDGTNYGRRPVGDIIEAANGKFYGMTYMGGDFDMGVLYEYNPIANLCVKKVDFNGPSKGASPIGNLIQAANGKLYGLTPKGGINDMGVLFSYDINTSTYLKIIEFDGTNNGSMPYGSLFESSDNILYGMTSQGGSSDNGTIFSFDPATNILTKKFEFNGVTFGSLPNGSFIAGNDGYLYGLTNGGGINSSGTMFKYDPVAEDFVKLVDFYDEDFGEHPSDDLFLASNGKMYGTASNAGTLNKGTFFEYDPVSNIFTKKFDFNATAEGAQPLGSLMYYSNEKLFGMTPTGGENYSGVIFEINPKDNSYNVRHNFDWMVDGGNPQGALIEASTGKIYGVTNSGGAHYGGTLFEFDPVTYNCQNLYSFEEIVSGYRPIGDLCEGPDGRLYGTAERGGDYGLGTLFSYDPASTNFVKLFDFNTTYGEWPYSGLALADNGKLYGMTYKGGTFNDGVLFEYDPVTFDFQVKEHFDGTNKGAHPRGSLLLDNGLLYGLATRGGVNDAGILFTYNPDTEQFSKKAEFDETTIGSYPAGSLLKASNGQFYGVSGWGGESGFGTIFKYNSASNILSKTTEFNGKEGKWPNACTLIEVEDESGVPGNEKWLFNIEIYPNPCSDATRVRYLIHDTGSLGSARDRYLIIDLFDISGRKIRELIHEKQTPGEYEKEINMSYLVPGVYFIRVQAGNEVAVRKLIVR